MTDIRHIVLPKGLRAYPKVSGCNHVICDGSFIDMNNCSVVSLAIASNSSYKKARKCIKSCGWTWMGWKKNPTFWDKLDSNRLPGYKVKEVTWGSKYCRGLGRWQRELNRGRYWLLVQYKEGKKLQSHALALVDGIRFDTVHTYPKPIGQIPVIEIYKVKSI